MGGDVTHLSKVVSKEVEIKIDVIFRRHPVALRAGIPDSFGPVGSPKMGILTTSPGAEPVPCTNSNAIFIDELRRVGYGIGQAVSPLIGSVVCRRKQRILPPPLEIKLATQRRQNFPAAGKRGFGRSRFRYPDEVGP